MIEALSCLANFPDPDGEVVNICKVMGSAPSAAWDVLPLNIKDVAKATIGDRVYGKLLNSVRSGEINKNDPDLIYFIIL